MIHDYEKPDKPTNNRIPRKAPKLEIPKETSNELWYQ